MLYVHVYMLYIYSYIDACQALAGCPEVGTSCVVCLKAWSAKFEAP